MAAGHEHRDGRLGQRPVLEHVDGDVGGEVVDAVQRHVERQGVRLGRRHADQQRTGQAGTGRHRDRVQVGQPVQTLQRPAHPVVAAELRLVALQEGQYPAV